MNPPSKPYRVLIERDTGRKIVKKLGASALAVYWGLACYRPNVRPSIDGLADDLGMKRSAVKNWLRALEAEKFIRRQFIAGGTTTYVLADGGDWEQSDSEPPKEGSQEVDLPMGEGVRNVTGGESTFRLSGGQKVDPEEDKRKKTTKKSSCPAAIAADEQTGNGSAAKLVFTDEDKAVADWFWQTILVMQPGRKAPKLESWANTVRLMRERDDRTHDQIRELFGRVQRDAFWRVNVLSPEKLRERWDDLQLRLQGNGNGKYAHRIGPGQKYDPTADVSAGW